MSVDYEVFARRLMRSLDNDKGYIYNLQTMYEMYDTTFKLHDHETTHDPFAGVSVLPKEQYLKNSMYDTHLRVYLSLKVREYTGLSIDEYLNRPRYMINSINRILRQEIHRHNKKLDDETAALNKELKNDLTKKDKNI